MFWFRPLFSCFILVCFENSLCATPITNTTSWRKKKSRKLSGREAIPNQRGLFPRSSRTPCRERIRSSRRRSIRRAIRSSSPRSSRRCRVRSLDPTTTKQAKINQFSKHVEILEEQYIDNEIQNHSERWKCNRSRSVIEWRKSLSQS